VPLLSTLATLSLSLFQERFLFDAFSGTKEAFSEKLSPTFPDEVSALSVIESTGTGTNPVTVFTVKFRTTMMTSGIAIIKNIKSFFISHLNPLIFLFKSNKQSQNFNNAKWN